MQFWNGFANLLFMIYFSLFNSSGFSLEYFQDIFAEHHFAIYYQNSLVVLFLVIIGNVIFCSMVSYALSRHQFKGKKIIFSMVLISLMIPKQILLIPIFILFFIWINYFYSFFFLLISFLTHCFHLISFFFLLALSLFCLFLKKLKFFFFF